MLIGVESWFRWVEKARKSPLLDAESRSHSFVVSRVGLMDKGAVGKIYDVSNENHIQAFSVERTSVPP